MKTQFVILSEPRSGTNFLVSSLNSHPDIICFGEIFNTLPAVRHQALIWPSQYNKQYSLVEKFVHNRDNPLDYVDTLYKISCSYKTIGSKIFFFRHLRPNILKKLVDHLVAQRVKFIHVYRENLLDRYLSHLLASQKNEYICSKTDIKLWKFSSDNNTRYNEAVNINFAHCVQSIRKSLEIQQKIRSTVPTELLLDVSYDSIVADLSQVQIFLNVQIQELKSDTIKQRTKPKNELILNYDQLRTSFLKNYPEGLIYFND